LNIECACLAKDSSVSSKTLKAWRCSMRAGRESDCSPMKLRCALAPKPGSKSPWPDASPWFWDSGTYCSKRRFVSVSRQAAILMSGKPGDAAFVDIRSIGGVTDEVNRKLSQQVCKLLNDSLGIPPDRVYLNFTDVEASNWGWNGSTFG